MNGEIRFRSDFTVQLVPDFTVGTDRASAVAAWAENPAAVDPQRDDTPAGHERVIRPCVKFAHNSPFEHGRMAVYVEAPGVVWWQWTRHRFMSMDTEDFSFSLESGRYKVLEPEFYVPPPDRPIWEPEGFKPMRPVLEANDKVNEIAYERLTHTLTNSWYQYESMVHNGVAREVARLCLPNWSLYCDGIVSASCWSWMQFFSKRRAAAETQLTTFPQWEIEQVATRCEELFAERWPIAYREFVANGRVAK